jgi:hypothetical protein
MKAATALSRRGFLKVTSYSALLTMVTVMTAGCSRDKNDLDIVAQRLIALLNHPERARELGAMYNAQLTETQPPSDEELTRQLLAKLGFDPKIITGHTLDTLETRFRQQVRQDFDDENIVIVKGWMLSKTEIMLCSLAAISMVS